jgi:hypothetical protein
MVKVVIPNIYTTRYTSCTPTTCIQKEIIISGVPGKHIKLDEFTLNLGVEIAGSTATSWVVTDVGGVEAVLANWTETSVAYQPKTAQPGFLGEVGKGVTFRWKLKTSEYSSKARMKDLTYTYTLVDEVIPPEKAQCMVVVECETEEEANAIAESLAGQGADVYTKKII